LVHDARAHGFPARSDPDAAALHDYGPSAQRLIGTGAQRLIGTGAQRLIGVGTLAADTSGAVRGVLWMILSSMFYALIYVVVRGLSETFDVNQIVFFRAVLGSAFMLPWLFVAGVSALRTSKIGLYLWRMFFSYIGAVAWMYGIAGMPLADANALMFTMPLFTLVMAAIWLAERPGLHRWAATAVGFAGALIILRPGVIEVSF
ncbi:unnamed protein product, partial [Laminaria digitata]